MKLGSSKKRKTNGEIWGVHKINEKGEELVEIETNEGPRGLGTGNNLTL